MAKSIFMGSVVNGIFSTFVVGISFLFSFHSKKRKTEEPPVKPTEVRMASFQNQYWNTDKTRFPQSNQKNPPVMVRTPKLVD